jgi:hypothetical protein
MRLSAPEFWNQVRFSSHDELLSAIARLADEMEGKMQCPPERLSPRPRTLARLNSLSSKYGLDELPPHTDGAHHRIPPRVVVLWCLQDDPTETPTYLRRFKPSLLCSDFWDRLKASIWSVRIRRELHFYRRPVSHDEISWDPGCFVNDRTERLERDEVDATLRGLPHEAVYWKCGAALIINNRRVLHSRAAVTDTIGNRELFRVLVS